MSRKGSSVMVKVGYHPLDIYLGQYILPFLIKQPDFAQIGSKNEGVFASFGPPFLRKS